MSDSVDLAEFRSAFVVEAGELLSLANANLLAVEIALNSGSTNARGVRELFRAVHTIKGLAAMVGVDPIVSIAHRLETTLRAADRAGGAIAASSIDTLLKALEAIAQRVRALAEGRPVGHPPSTLLDALDALDAPPRTEVPSASTVALSPPLLAKLSAAEVAQLVDGAKGDTRIVQADFAPSSERAQAGLSITSVRLALAELGEIVKVVPISIPPSESGDGWLVFAILLLTSASEATIAARMGVEADAVRTIAVTTPEPVFRDADAPLVPDDEELPERDVDSGRPGVVRVEVDRLDDAIERLSALVVTRFRLGRAVAALTAAGANTRDLREIVDENARQLRDLRAALLRVRMVPVVEVLDRVPLLVRGLARATGKKVRLEIDAGKAELDKAVAERIFPALVHLVRNAVDHALEQPGDRQRAGKPEEGLLRIACFERSNTQLEISVSDDGRGVDRQAVALKAGRPVPATEAELLELLCQPGLSTRAEVSTTSGRGMGMDIVKRIVDQLGGELLLQTSPGVGTRFTVHVPLTISIVDAFLFECAAQLYVVPVRLIEEIIELEPSKLTRGPSRPGMVSTTQLLERRGETVPLVQLEALFQRGAGAGAGALARKALVVRRNGAPIAFAVDRLVGQQEVVVRPIEDALVRAPGIAGATDLGDGRPTLVLDLAALGATLIGGPAATTSAGHALSLSGPKLEPSA